MFAGAPISAHKRYANPDIISDPACLAISSISIVPLVDTFEELFD